MVATGRDCICCSRRCLKRPSSRFPGRDPGMMNDAAYELAKAGLDLPLAESTAKDALARLSAESKTWTLQENPQNTLAKSRRIASAWDTVGWVLYRQGRFGGPASSQCRAHLPCRHLRTGLRTLTGLPRATNLSVRVTPPQRPQPYSVVSFHRARRCQMRLRRTDLRSLDNY